MANSAGKSRHEGLILSEGNNITVVSVKILERVPVASNLHRDSIAVAPGIRTTVSFGMVVPDTVSQQIHRLRRKLVRSCRVNLSYASL